MGALFGYLARMLAVGLGAFFGGWRTWIAGLLVKTILVVVLYNVMASFFGDILSWVATKLGAVTTPGAVVSTLNIAGWSTLGAWFVSIMRIPECFAFMVSIIILKFALRKIPVIRW